MRIYLGIKFYEDHSNKSAVEGISNRLAALGHSSYCVAKDLEKWGQKEFNSKELMKLTFAEIDRSDLVLIEFSEKGVGLGIEAGYAHSKNIPVQVIAKKGSPISNTMKGIATSISFYESYSDIVISEDNKTEDKA